MLIVLGIYAALIWLVFFQFKLLPWKTATKVLVSLIGLIIGLVVVGLLNTRTPSGRVTVLAQVNQIAPVVGGVLAKVPVEANKPVEAGTVLFELDQRPYQYAVDEARASLRIAEMTLSRQQTVFDRGGGSVSQQTLDETTALVDQTRARLDKARYDLEQTVVLAPTDGVVTSLGASEGDQARPLAPVLPFIRTDSIFLAGVFSQNGVGALAPGTPVKMVLNRSPGRIFTTEVVGTAAGTASGQIPVGAELLGASDIGGASDALVILAWPDDLDYDIGIAGAVGSATAFGPNAGAMRILATVILYVKSLGTYL